MYPPFLLGVEIPRIRITTFSCLDGSAFEESLLKRVSTSGPAIQARTACSVRASASLSLSPLARAPKGLSPGVGRHLRLTPPSICPQEKQRQESPGDLASPFFVSTVNVRKLRSPPESGAHHLHTETMRPRTPVRLDRCYVQNRICKNTQPALAESLGHRHTLLEAQGSHPPRPCAKLSLHPAQGLFPTPASGSFLLAIGKDQERGWAKGARWVATKGEPRWENRRRRGGGSSPGRF